MREIKFRGRDLNTGEWTYGHFMTYDDCPSIQYTDRDGFNCYDMVDPETVGQYTGLKDKNGVEIYEGDIVKYKGDLPVAVEFADGQFQMAKSTEYRKSSIGLFADESEVISNIHENPELLK